MLKRLCLAFAGLFALASVAHGAGTVPGFSLYPQFDLTGKIAPGCKLYVIQAGTTSTPQNAYQDSGLSILQPNPLTCDAAGRLPLFFVADGVIKVRLTDKNGVQIFVGDNLPVIGPSSGGGGGGGTIDPTTIAATGDLKVAYGTSILSGWVRANGRTIGSATSGATERANADCQALFQYLWGADSNLSVSGGRGASAAADWAANKTIALPDARSRSIAGLGDMGNSDNALLSGVTFTSGNSTTLGAALGAARRTLTSSQLPANIPYTLTWGFTPSAGSSTYYIGATPPATSSAGGGAGIPLSTSPAAVTFNGSIAVTGGAINPSGGSAFDSISPYLLATIYIKL